MVDFLFVVLAVSVLSIGGAITFKKLVAFLESWKQQQEGFKYSDQDFQADLKDVEMKANLTINKLMHEFNVQKVAIAADLGRTEVLSEMRFEGVYPIEKFQDKLKELDFHISSIGEFCELTSGQDGKKEVACSATYKIVFPTGNIGYITAHFSEMNPVYWEIEKEVICLRNITFHHPNLDVEFFKELHASMEELTIQRKPFTPTWMGKEKVRTFTIKQTLMGLELQETVFNYKRPSKFNEAYKIKVKVGGSNFVPNASETLELLQELCEFPVNIGVTGPVGTGKTTFSYYLTQDMEDSCVITLTSGDLDNLLKSSESLQRFAELVKEQEGSYDNVILLLDEADKALKTEANISVMNGFLDGNLRKQLGDKVSIMLIFNSEINQLPPSITRPGRLHAQIHVGKINKDKGLVVLKSLAEEEKVVDIKAYNKFTETRNEVSLAEVYQFVIEKSIHAKLLTLVERKLGKSQQTPIFMK